MSTTERPDPADREPAPAAHDSGELLPGAVDARFTLAAERTALAWLRTALGLIAAGVAVMHLLDPFGDSHAGTALGIALLAIGIFAAVVGGLRWRAIDRALRTGGVLPGAWPVWTLTALIVLVAIGFAAWA